MTGREFLNAVANGKRDILAAVLRILRHTQAPYCVIGGLAVNAYAEPVVSLDLDIVVALDKVEEVCAAAEAQGLTVRRFEHSVNLTSPDSDLRIQLQTDERYQKFIERAVETEVLGYTMRVADPRDVLRGKLWAYQDTARRPSKRQKDLADILRLLEAHPELREVVPPGILPQ